MVEFVVDIAIQLFKNKNKQQQQQKHKKTNPNLTVQTFRFVANYTVSKRYWLDMT